MLGDENYENDWQANPLHLILSQALSLLFSLFTLESGAVPIIRHQINQKAITEICLSAHLLVLFSLSVLCANHQQLFFVALFCHCLLLFHQFHN